MGGRVTLWLVCFKISMLFPSKTLSVMRSSPVNSMVPGDKQVEGLVSGGLVSGGLVSGGAGQWRAGQWPAGLPTGQQISRASARFWLVRSHPSCPREPAWPQCFQSRVTMPQTLFA